MSFFAGLYHPGEDRLYPPGDSPRRPAWQDGPLIPVYDFELLADSLPEPAALTGSDDGTLRRHYPLLPLDDPEPLENGDLPVTPLEPAPPAADCAWKREDQLPGGSSLAREAALVEARGHSSPTDWIGTGSPSRLLAHAERNLQASSSEILLIPSESRSLLDRLAGIEGTVPVQLEADRTEVFELMDRVLDVTGLQPSTPPQDPYGLEATKTVAYEMIAQRESTPRTVVLPAGDGSLVYGLWKGFYELVRLGWIERVPRMVPVALPADARVGDPFHLENRQVPEDEQVAWPRMGDGEVSSRVVDLDRVEHVHRTAEGPAGASRGAALVSAGWDSYRRDHPDAGDEPVVLVRQDVPGIDSAGDPGASREGFLRADPDPDSLMAVLREQGLLPSRNGD